MDPTKKPAPGGSTRPPPVKCTRCQSGQVQLVGRMEGAKESIYRCSACGRTFTA